MWTMGMVSTVQQLVAMTRFPAGVVHHCPQLDTHYIQWEQHTLRGGEMGKSDILPIDVNRVIIITT